MELCSMLYSSLDGRGVWRRMDTCMYMAESFYYAPEAVTTLLISYAMRVQPCSTLCDPTDCIFQARILEWVTISSSRGPSQPKDPTHILCGYCISRHILYH